MIWMFGMLITKIFLDIKILYLTVMKVISREGITEGSVTSNKFEGNEGFKE